MADAAHQKQQLLVLLRLIPLPALINRMLCCAQDEPPELSAIHEDDLFSRCVCLCAPHQDPDQHTGSLPQVSHRIPNKAVFSPTACMSPALQHEMVDRQSLHP